MKTAIYIEDGVTQLVLTPETLFEKQALNAIADAPTQAFIKQGSFYDCQGGWTRHGNSDRSLIVRLDRSPQTTGSGT